MPDDAGTLRVGWGTERDPSSLVVMWVTGQTDVVSLAPMPIKPANPATVQIYVMDGRPAGASDGPDTGRVTTESVTVTEDTPARAFGLTISLVGVEEDADGKGGYYVLEIDPPRGAPWH